MSTVIDSLYWEARIDYSKLIVDIQNVKKEISGLGSESEKQAAIIDNSFSRLEKALAAYLSLQTISRSIEKLVTVRGEFEKLGVSMETILGSKAKADSLMRDIVTLANTTPFKLTEVGEGAKKLLAFQVAQEDVISTLTRLGNVAAGVSVPIDRLILVYGQVKAKGRLMGDDLRQFTEAGIPMIHELAKVMGITDSKVTQLVEDGQIGFSKVQKVIENLTNSGGMFYNLMEKQSKTMPGMLSNLGDAWDSFLNTTGKNTEGFTKNAIGTLTSMINELNDLTTFTSKITAKSYKEAFGTNINDELVKLNSLFETAKDINASLDTRQEAIKQINSNYGNYIHNLSLEKSSLTDIVIAQEQATQAMIKNMAIKAKQADIEDILNKNIDNERIITKPIIKSVNGRVNVRK